MLHMKIFLLNFNDFTINENVLSSVGQSTKRMRAEIIWFGFLREEILSWRRHYPEVLKLMVNNFVLFFQISIHSEYVCKFLKIYVIIQRPIQGGVYWGSSPSWISEIYASWGGGFGLPPLKRNRNVSPS